MEWENKDSLELVKTWTADFKAESVKNAVLEGNVEYLEKTLVSLEAHRTKCENDQKTANTARARAVARDTEKTLVGFINGVKFGISFLLYGKEGNLSETDNPSRKEEV